MEDAGFIDEAARKNAAATRPRIARASATPGAGYFVDYVLSQLPESLRNSNEHLIVETTLDLDLQREGERALVLGLLKDGPKLAAHQGALVAMTPEGAIRALIGGRSYVASPYDRATARAPARLGVQAVRLPGPRLNTAIRLPTASSTAR